MPQFNSAFYSSQIFWLVIAFGLLYFIVDRFIAPKAEQILTNRQTSIESEANNAEMLVKKAKELELSYNNEIKNAWNAAENLKQEALAKLEASFVAKKQQLFTEIEQQTKEASQEIAAAIAAYRLNEQESCINLAAFIAEKITKQPPANQLLKHCYEKIK